MTNTELREKIEEIFLDIAIIGGEDFSSDEQEAIDKLLSLIQSEKKAYGKDEYNRGFVDGVRTHQDIIEKEYQAQVKLDKVSELRQLNKLDPTDGEKGGE